MPVLMQLWDLLADIPTNVNRIQQSFLGFPIGTDREDILSWFEYSNPEFSVKAVHEAVPVEDLELTIIVMGDIENGFEFVGPMPSRDESIDWAEMYVPSFMDWHSVMLVNPSKWLADNNIKEE
jgi:hypothetical protein